MTRPGRASWATVVAEEERYRPLYARALGLRFVNPGGVLCFLFFEGAVALAALLALAELVTWWAVLVLPAAVAVMVKLNDMVAEMVVRTAALVPEQERDRFRREMEPAVGRAPVWAPGAVGREGARVAVGHAGAVATTRSAPESRVVGRSLPDRGAVGRGLSDRGAVGRSGADRGPFGWEASGRGAVGRSAVGVAGSRDVEERGASTSHPRPGSHPHPHPRPGPGPHMVRRAVPGILAGPDSGPDLDFDLDFGLDPDSGADPRS